MSLGATMWCPACRLSSELQQLRGQVQAAGSEHQRATEEAQELVAANAALQQQLKVTICYTMLPHYPVSTALGRPPDGRTLLLLCPRRRLR